MSPTVNSFNLTPEEPRAINEVKAEGKGVQLGTPSGKKGVRNNSKATNTNPPKNS